MDPWWPCCYILYNTGAAGIRSTSLTLAPTNSIPGVTELELLEDSKTNVLSSAGQGGLWRRESGLHYWPEYIHTKTLLWLRAIWVRGDPPGRLGSLD